MASKSRAWEIGRVIVAALTPAGRRAHGWHPEVFSRAVAQKVGPPDDITRSPRERGLPPRHSFLARCSVLKLRALPSNPFHGALRAQVEPFTTITPRGNVVPLLQVLHRLPSSSSAEPLGFAPGLPGAPSASVQARGFSHPFRRHLGSIWLPSRSPKTSHRE